jgi:hypothetical protein
MKDKKNGWGDGGMVGVEVLDLDVWENEEGKEG